MTTYNYGEIPFAETTLAQRIAYNGTLAEYIGFARPGTGEAEDGWMICKLSYDGSNQFIKRTWADGTNFQDKVWDNRASYEYA